MAQDTQLFTKLHNYMQTHSIPGMPGGNQSRIESMTYNPRYPGFDEANYKKLESKVDALGLVGNERQKAMDQLYVQVLPQVQNQIINSDRREYINDAAYEVSQIQDKSARTQAKTKLTVTDLSQQLKETFNIDPTANDEDVFNSWIESIPNGEQLLVNYLNDGNPELLYVGGLADRTEESTETETKKKSFGDKVEEFGVGVAQSPGKRGYNMIGQWMDKLGKAVADKLEGTELAEWVRNQAIDAFGEDEVKAFAEQRQKELAEGTAFNGREATDIRTPILGEERANSKNVKAGETVGDIGTAIALTYPLGAATAPIMADSTAVGAGLLGAGEGILDTTLAHVGSKGDLNIKPGEIALGGITGGLGGLFTRYLANLPKGQADNIRKEASKYIEKSIKPTVKGKENQVAYNKFIDDTLDVAHAMSKNKGILKYSDDAGEIVTGKLPTNLRETSETLGNMKKVIYDQYNEIAKQAGDAGARVNMNKAFDQLDDLTKDISQNISNPGTKGIVDKFKETLLEYTDDAGTISIDDAQKITQDFNQQLTAFFKNQNMNDVSKSSIVAKLNKWTKDAIDDSIDDAFNSSISNGSSMSTQYNQLKSLYSKIKTIEDEIAKRALVDARKNAKGISSTILDSLTGGEFTEALLTFDPVKAGKAGVMKAISKYYNYLNNPNTQIKNLFELVDRTYNPSTTASTIQSIKEGIRGTAPSVAPAVIPGTIAVEETLTND